MKSLTCNTLAKNGITYYSMPLAARELDVSTAVIFEAIKRGAIRDGLLSNGSWWVPECEVERVFFDCITQGVHLTAFFNEGLPRLHDDSFSVPREVVYKGIVYVSFKEAESITGIPYATVRNMAMRRSFRTLTIIGAHRYITRREAYYLRSSKKVA